MRKTLIGSSMVIMLLASSGSALNLQESLDLALKQNPAILSAQKRVDAAGAKYNQAVGAFFPTIKVDGTYGKAWSSPATMQFTTQTTGGAVTQTITAGSNDQQTMSSLQASLSQPIFFAALFPGYSIAQKTTDLAKEDFRKTVLDTSFNVTRTYFGVLMAEKTVKLAEESKQMAESHLNQVKALLAAGVATRADLLRAEVQLANSDIGLTKAKNGLNLAKDAFNNALGNDLEEPVQLAEVGLTGTITSQPAYKELLTISYENRPDWRQYQLTKGIGEENLRVQQTSYLPSVMLTASSGNQISEYPTYKSDVNSWNVVGAASWTLFDGLGRENRIKEAADNLGAQRATEEQVKNGIALEVRDAYLNLNSALETIASTTKAVDSAQEGYKVSSLRFASGAGTNLEVIDAQVSLTQAKFTQLQALFDVEIAKAKINKIVGKEVL